MIPSDIRLYTWIDVEEVLFRIQEQNKWPEWLIWTRAYWDNLTIAISPGNQGNARKWLQEIFDPRFQFKEGESEGIILESLKKSDRILPILFEETEEDPINPRLTPSLSRSTVLWAKSQNPQFPPILSEDFPPVVAFYSFKGGVGRTTHTLALAKALAIEKKKVLIVDGDLEAPGISWIFERRFPNPPVAFADFLALVHGDTSEDAENAIQLVAERLADAMIEDGIHVLPSFRSTEKFTSLEIRPEHLIQGAKNPFILTQILARLGQVLGVDVVLVDLRAGLSELATGLILDPRVYRIFVTTLSEQSILGTIKICQLITTKAISTREEDPLPAFIISQIPQDYLQNKLEVDAEVRLLEAAHSFIEEDRQPLRLFTPFTDNLLVLRPTWEEVIDQIQRAGIIDNIRYLLDWLPINRSQIIPENLNNLKSEREKLTDSAKQLEYAENAEVDQFLSTIPLQRLASDHRHRIPITVVVGAKGSGKTYTFLQIIRRETWQTFVQDAKANEVQTMAFIGAILESKNLNSSASALVKNVRSKTAKALGFNEPMDSINIRDYIRDNCHNNLHEGQWRERWLDVIAWGVGFQNKQEGAGKRLTEYLVKQKQQVVVLIDGLEDLFQDFSTNDSQKIALRSLLQDVPEWLSQQPHQPLGIIIFVRRDIVLAVIRQNAAQMMSRYDPYALKWNKEEALKLVVWVIKWTQINIGINIDKLDINEEELTQVLIALWGKKLGKDNSREARSTPFVIAALSDFKGQIQARDLVRFLYLAAAQSINDTRWQDRILIPTAIKGALPECGVKKIEEIELENPPLKNIFSKLRDLRKEQRKIPFSREDTKLSLEEMKTLEDNGVVIREGDDYYMPEIFRLGLNFSVSGAGRSQVLSLARRAAQGMK